MKGSQCTWESNRPGMMNLPARSITCAPAGAGASAGTRPRMVFPSIRIARSRMGVSASPSIIVAPLMRSVEGACAKGACAYADVASARTPVASKLSKVRRLRILILPLGRAVWLHFRVSHASILVRTLGPGAQYDTIMAFRDEKNRSKGRNNKAHLRDRAVIQRAYGVLVPDIATAVLRGVGV